MIAFAFAAGLASGTLGVGGGVLFVPALVVFAGQSQLEAEATSLLAIIPVSIAGVWRQQAYGNVRLQDGLAIGALSVVGAGLGTVLANSVPERSLEVAFAGVALYFAVGLAKRAMSEPDGV